MCLKGPGDTVYLWLFVVWSYETSTIEPTQRVVVGVVPTTGRDHIESTRENVKGFSVSTLFA